MIKAHQIFLWVGFWLAVLAYQDWFTGDMETWEGYSIHSKLMALSYCFILWAMHRLETIPLTRFSVNVILGACVANLADEFFFDPTKHESYELIVFGIIFIISFILFIRKQPKYALWLRKFKRQ